MAVIKYRFSEAHHVLHRIATIVRQRCSDRASIRGMRTLTMMAAIVGVIQCATGPVHGLGATSSSTIERFLAHREDVPLVQYRAVRQMRARNERFKKEARMEVLTTLDRAMGFRYEVLAQEGSGVVRRRALEPILEGEAKALREGIVSRAALSTLNYDFESAAAGFAASAVEEAGIRIRPRRRDSVLVDGTIFVRPDDGDLVRIEGRLAKSPSFWTSRVEVVREYQRIAGVRVPVRMRSRAWVRFAGQSTLEITYAYEEINGEPVAAVAPR